MAKPFDNLLRVSAVWWIYHVVTAAAALWMMYRSTVLFWMMHAEVNAKSDPSNRLPVFPSTFRGVMFGELDVWDRHAALYPHSPLRRQLIYSGVIFMAAWVACVLPIAMRSVLNP